MEKGKRKKMKDLMSIEEAFMEIKPNKKRDAAVKRYAKKFTKDYKEVLGKKAKKRTNTANTTTERFEYIKIDLDKIYDDLSVLQDLNKNIEDLRKEATNNNAVMCNMIKIFVELEQKVSAQSLKVDKILETHPLETLFVNLITKNQK